MRGKRIFRRRSFKKSAGAPSNQSVRQNGSFFEGGAGAESTFFTAGQSTISRKCDKCEKEEKGKVQREATSASSSTAPSKVSSYVSSLSGQGSPLPNKTRQFFEPKFNADFSGVRVHNNEQSSTMTSSVHAKAFTHKNNIVFNKGQYDTESTAGKQLLAHELTHVVQQNPGISRMEVEKGEEEKLQRAPAPHSDFVIRGINPDSASFPSTIFFEFASAHVTSGERGKLGALATPPARSLTLTGTVSEEGDPAFNTELLNNRINNVSEWLRIKGHKGPRLPNPQAGITSGNKDYRKQRAVDIMETPGVIPEEGVRPAHIPDCDAGFIEPCPVLLAPYGLSLFWLSAALSKMGSPTPAIRTQVGSLFPGVPFATVEDNLKKLMTQMGILPSVVECHNDCDGACDRGAKNNGTGATSKMTLCRSFHDDPVSEQAETFLHESLHATPGVETVDIAYSTTRLIDSLSGPQALQNTDSYVALILRLAGVSPLPSDPPPVDTFPGLSGPEETLAKPPIAFLEQWLLNSESDSAFVYDAIGRNIGHLVGGSAQWDTDDDFWAGLMHSISPQFGVTDPGDTSPFKVTPVETDRWVMAGVYDRYNKMMRAVYQTPLDVKKLPVGLGRWAAGMGPSVEIGNPFFDPALSVFDRVKYLLRLLILSVPGQIPSSRINAYIEGADAFRKGRSTGP